MGALALLSATLETATSGLRAYVVVDSLVGGRAMGGTRMTATVSPAELGRLARQMTLKLALAELPIGGAKAGIVSALPPGPERDAQLQSFGTASAPLLHGGVYLGTDQGVSYRDRAMFFDAAGYDVCLGRRLPCTWAELWDRCCDITGHGVAEATAVAANQVGFPGRRPRVVIQGFGTVGRGTAKRLSQLGFCVVGVADHQGTVVAPAGLPLPELLAATDVAGTIDRSALPADVGVSSVPEAWLDVDTDVLVLAATGGAVRADNVGRVTARLVVEGANEPCTDEAITALGERGVPVVPGIVANCGGAMVTGLVLTGGAPAAGDPDTLARWLYDRIATHVRSVLVEVFDRARLEGCTVPDAAIRTGDELALAAAARSFRAAPAPAPATTTSPTPPPSSGEDVSVCL